MDINVAIPTEPTKYTVRCGDSSMELDLVRYLFGDGDWVVTIHGDDVFS